MPQTFLTLLNREGVRRQTIEAGLLTDGSSYSPTPSQQRVRQWLVLLAFVPDHSGAPVRESHPLPVSLTHIAAMWQIGPQCRLFCTADQQGRKIRCIENAFRRIEKSTDQLLCNRRCGKQ